MQNSRSQRRRSERGEGTGRFIVYLLGLCLLGYLGIKNVPIYLDMQNLKHDLADTTRSAGTKNLKADEVSRALQRIREKYNIPEKDVVYTLDGRLLKVKLATTKSLDLLVTDYDWQVKEEWTSAPL